MNNNMEKEIFEIYIDDIIPNRFQPRLTFDEGALNELAASIKQHGIIQPLVVRKIGDKYEIIAGERRYKASQIAGLQKVPVVIMNLDDSQSAEVAVVENIQRKDLTALEEAESYKKLLDKGYLTQEQLANRMGKTQATISNKLRLLGLQNEVKEALLNQKISERHARSLLSLKNPVEQIDALHKIINNKMTVKQTDDMIKAMVAPADFVAPPANEQVETLDFEQSVPAETDSPIPQNIPEPMPSVPITEVVPIVPEDNMPIVPFTEENNANFTPIPRIDVDQIKEQAVDINPPQQLANVDVLLGAQDGNQQPVIEQPTIEADKPRFIPFFDNNEDEENDEQKEEILPQPIPVEPPTNDVPAQEIIPITSVDAPVTNTDSLISEFRQSNAHMIDQSKITPGNLRSAINAIRDVTSTLEKNDFKVDVEEFDFEGLYQIIIKINK